MLLSSQPRAGSEKVKIMQINVEKGGKIGAPPSFLVLAFYRVSKEK